MRRKPPNKANKLFKNAFGLFKFEINVNKVWILLLSCTLQIQNQPQNCFLSGHYLKATLNGRKGPRFSHSSSIFHASWQNSAHEVLGLVCHKTWKEFAIRTTLLQINLKTLQHWLEKRKCGRKKICIFIERRKVSWKIGFCLIWSWHLRKRV